MALIQCIENRLAGHQKGVPALGFTGQCKHWTCAAFEFHHNPQTLHCYDVGDFEIAFLGSG